MTKYIDVGFHHGIKDLRAENQRLLELVDQLRQEIATLQVVLSRTNDNSRVVPIAESRRRFVT